MTIFVVSDTHFGHANFLNFTDENGNPIRPFKSVEEVDQLMLDNWNRVVTDSDIVYHLGDVYFAGKHGILNALKGKKRLLLGNHDNGKDENLHKVFQKIELWRVFKEWNCLLTHIPIHESGLYKVDYNVHGHIHQQKSPTPRHINVSVEQINYTPVPLESLMKGKFS